LSLKNSSFPGGGYQWEVDGHKERGNEGEYGRCVLLSMYENRRMKPVKIVLRRDEGE
jgi:hypothetical protein